MDWLDQKKMAELAELKFEINTLEKKAKEIQEDLIKKYGEELPKDWTFSEGKLVLCSRQNWDKVKNSDVIPIVGQDLFNKYATITATGLKEAGGQTLIDKLVHLGSLRKKPATVYYSLKVDKGV
jgi:hypothetical protein